MAGVLDLLQAALQNPEALRQLQQAMGRYAASLPGDWEGPPGFWRDLPPGEIPAQPPWTLGGDNVVSPPSGLGANAAGIYGRAPERGPAPLGDLLRRVSMGPPPRPLLGSPQEYAARQQPGREQALMSELFAGRMFGPQGGVVSDGDYPAGWGSGLRGNAYPARPSPLNQFMPGAGLY